MKWRQEHSFRYTWNCGGTVKSFFNQSRGSCFTWFESCLLVNPQQVFTCPLVWNGFCLPPLPWRPDWSSAIRFLNANKGTPPIKSDVNSHFWNSYKHCGIKNDPYSSIFNKIKWSVWLLSQSTEYLWWFIHNTRLEINVLLRGFDYSLLKIPDAQLCVPIQISVSLRGILFRSIQILQKNCCLANHESMTYSYTVRFLKTEFKDVMHINGANKKAREADSNHRLFLGACLWYKCSWAICVLQKCALKQYCLIGLFF